MVILSIFTRRRRELGALCISKHYDPVEVHHCVFFFTLDSLCLFEANTLTTSIACLFFFQEFLTIVNNAGVLFSFLFHVEFTSKENHGWAGFSCSRCWGMVLRLPPPAWVPHYSEWHEYSTRCFSEINLGRLYCGCNSRYLDLEFSSVKVVLIYTV